MFGLPDYVRYIKEFVILRFYFNHTSYCNFGRDIENPSLHRGVRYIEVRYIEVPLYIEVKIHGGSYQKCGSSYTGY